MPREFIQIVWRSGVLASAGENVAKGIKIILTNRFQTEISYKPIVLRAVLNIVTTLCELPILFYLHEIHELMKQFHQPNFYFLISLIIFRRLFLSAVLLSFFP